MREKDRRKRKKRRFNLETYTAGLWATTVLYILAAGFCGVLSVAFLLFDFLTVGNMLAFLTKALAYAVAVNFIFSVVLTIDYAIGLKKEE